MRGLRSRLGALLAAAALAGLGLTGCGAGTSTSSSRARGPVTLLMAQSPNSLDPALADTPQALQADWLVYTPLLTYAHSGGVPGTQVIPGLASAPPTISDGGRTYALSLQPGLVYSDGEPVKASDFTWAVERAIRLRRSGAPELITRRIAGAEAFAARHARTISGIQTDDATGQIMIHLTAPWGSFDNVLASPALAPVPRATPLREMSSHPPPGVGAYVFGPVVAGRSFSLLLNPRWRPGQLPFIPPGHVDVEVRITGDARANTLAVLSNRADVFDASDRVPPALLGRVRRQAAGRYAKQAINTTDVIFLNVAARPFSSRLARTAVQTALDYGVLKRLGAGALQEGCYLLPPAIWGHPHDQCPQGNIESGGNVAAARALVARSGMAGSRVTVWSPTGRPAASWMGYYTSLLHRIGFRARLKLVSDADYYATIGRLRLHPQTGFGELTPTLPSPVDFYERLTASAIRDQRNQNWSQVDDPYLNRQVGILGAIPSTSLEAVAGYWHGLERYVANRAYLAVFGYRTAPVLASSRLAYAGIRLSPVVGLDWGSLRLK